MSQEVIALKLVSGEEIISRVVDTDEDGNYRLEKPNMVGVAQGPQGLGIQMMPWFASNQDGEVVVSGKHVVAKTLPTENLVKGYLEQTSSIQMITG